MISGKLALIIICILLLYLLFMDHGYLFDIIIENIGNISPKIRAKRAQEKAESEKKAQKKAQELELARQKRVQIYSRFKYASRFSKVLTCDQYKSQIIMAFDEIDKKIYFYKLGKAGTTDIVSDKKIISFSSLIGVELKKENTVITSTNNNTTGNTIKRAIVGGVVAGGAGAVVGALTSKNNTSTMTNHQSERIDSIVLYISDISDPKIELRGCSQTFYNDLYATAKAVISQNEKIDQVN